MAHIHLKAYFELALHDEDDDDEADCAENHPQQQLGCSQTAHTVAAMEDINYCIYILSYTAMNTDSVIV